MLYTVTYFAFGNLVAVPLAGPAFNEYYHGLQLPAWMPLLQVARGALWALIMVPTPSQLTAGSTDRFARERTTFPNAMNYR